MTFFKTRNKYRNVVNMYKILLEWQVLVIQLVLTRGHYCSCNAQETLKISDEIA